MSTGTKLLKLGCLIFHRFNHLHTYSALRRILSTSQGFAFINQVKPFNDALAYCRENFHDLASIHNDEGSSAGRKSGRRRQHPNYRLLTISQKAGVTQTRSAQED